MQSKTTGQTLPLVRRIRQSSEYEQAFHADRLTNKWFVVHLRKNERGFSRLGLVVSKRTMPKAVARNFAKRLIREVFRRNFPAELAFDVVVRIRRQINSENSIEGRLALTQILKGLQS